MNDQLKLNSALVAVRLLLVVMGMITVGVVVVISLNVQSILSSFVSA